MNETHKTEARDHRRSQRHDGDRHKEGATPPPSEGARDEEARGAEAKIIPPLVNRNGHESFQSRWYAVQMDFIDGPRAAVDSADALVTEVIDYLSEALAMERENIKRDWRQRDEFSTEELRLALQDYRALFDHLISI